MYFEGIDDDKIPVLAKKMDTFFCCNLDIRKNAYLNWRMNRHDVAQSFIEIAKGYSESAFQLIDVCLKDNVDKKADIWVFPILHCIVHSIELDLKAINFYLAKLLNVEPKIEGQHKIQQICCTASKRLDEIKKQNLLNNCGELILAIKVVKNFIDNIYKNTNDMSFVRYPINRKKEPMFYTMSYENVVVDIEKMRDQYTYVCLMMEGVLNCIFAQLDSNG